MKYDIHMKTIDKKDYFCDMSIYYYEKYKNITQYKQPQTALILGFRLILYEYI